ncbi:MAG: hypothetical protein ACI906_002915 [Candidatus Latescibacterota bacterium]|jgi:hypothetical protein
MAQVRIFLALFLILFFTPLLARGDVGDLGVLRTEQRKAAAVRDSLEGQRRKIVAGAEGLSSHIDSLKEVEGEVDQLHEALRTSLGLVQRLVALDRALEAVRAREDSLLAQLRVGYDWEIGVLIQQLQEQPDEGLLTQLMVYQEARESLGARTSDAILRFDEGMTISSDDGPGEIRQKLELMEDLGQRLERDARNVSDHLHKIEEEYRLRVRMRSFTNEMRLFDEHLPEGRGVVSLADGAESGRLVSEGGIAEGLAPALLRGSEVQRQEEGVVLRGVSSDEVLLEIHKWKARQQEILQLESVVRERTVAFRRYLQEMLEGAE